MAVIRDDSQQTTANITVVDDDGTRKTVACASCHIRPGKGMTFTLDAMDEAAGVDEESMAAVRASIAAYMGEEIQKAAALGVPVAMPVLASDAG